MKTLCEVTRRKKMSKGTLNFATGESKILETYWITEECGTPLFSEKEMASGECKGCHAGWSQETNYRVDPSDPHQKIIDDLKSELIGLENKKFVAADDLKRVDEIKRILVQRGVDHPGDAGAWNVDQHKNHKKSNNKSYHKNKYGKQYKRA